MRRVIGSTSDGLRALSLLVCLAACVLWVRSYFADDWLWWTDGRRVVIGVATARGSLRCYRVTTGGDRSLFYDVPGGVQHVGHRTEQPSFDKVDDQYAVPDLEWSLAGFGFTRGRWSSRARHTDASVPLAALALASSVLPARSWWRKCVKVRP